MLDVIERAKPRSEPVLGLARLAVDDMARGLGLGRQLLRLDLQLALELSESDGCAGVVVDAKPGAVAFYAKYGFTAFDVLEGKSPARPREMPMSRPSARSRLRPIALTDALEHREGIFRVRKRVPG